MPDFEKSRQLVIEPTRATARLPGLLIEIIHRQTPSGAPSRIPLSLDMRPGWRHPSRTTSEAFRTPICKSVARRIVDRRVLHLIKMWLECAVEETDDRGRKTRATEARDKRRGIPQGSPLSPLLANLYMRRFVLGWKMLGLEHGARRAGRQVLAREA
jgi:hypothetical protein